MAEESNEVDPGRIRNDIERTRENMSDTIDEIQERLKPSTLIQQAKDSVREKTVDKVKHAMRSAEQQASRAAGQVRTQANTAVDQAREHPLPVALLVSGLAWLVTRVPRGRSSQPSFSARSSRASFTEYGGQYPGERGHRAWWKPDGRAYGALVAGALSYYLISRKTAGSRGVTAASGRLGSGAAPGVPMMGGSARQISRRAHTDYVELGRKAGRAITRWVGNNPLPVGLAVVALGTVAGLAPSAGADDLDDDLDSQYESHRPRYRYEHDVRGDDYLDSGGGADSEVTRMADDYSDSRDYSQPRASTRRRPL